MPLAIKALILLSFLPINLYAIDKSPTHSEAPFVTLDKNNPSLAAIDTLAHAKLWSIKLIQKQVFNTLLNIKTHDESLQEKKELLRAEYFAQQKSFEQIDERFLNLELQTKNVKKSATKSVLKKFEQKWRLLIEELETLEADALKTKENLEKLKRQAKKRASHKSSFKNEAEQVLEQKFGFAFEPKTSFSKISEQRLWILLKNIKQAQNLSVKNLSTQTVDLMYELDTSLHFLEKIDFGDMSPKAKEFIKHLIQITSNEQERHSVLSLLLNSINFQAKEEYKQLNLDLEHLPEQSNRLKEKASKIRNLKTQEAYLKSIRTLEQQAFKENQKLNSYIANDFASKVKQNPKILTSFSFKQTDFFENIGQMKTKLNELSSQIENSIKSTQNGKVLCLQSFRNKRKAQNQ